MARSACASHSACVKRDRSASLHTLMHEQTYLVLEDDAVFRPHLGERFRQMLLQLPAHWDMLYLGYNTYFRPSHDCVRARKRSPCDAEANLRLLCRAKGGLIDAHAIIFHARAWRWLLPLLAKIEASSTPLMPYDLEVCNARASWEQ